MGECLGEGGMGRVHAAFDHQLGRLVALKFLTHPDPAVRRLFLQEARSQAKIQHPNVLDIYDSGLLDGRPFIAMRHVAGGTLAEIGPGLSLEQRVRLLAQVAEGLHAAHREGLLHRDVKPSNVLVHHTEDGELEALVTDFGLATELVEPSVEVGAETVDDMLAGSPHYLAPELLDGSPPADRRSDIYSLGITLYRLLVGRLDEAGEHLRAELELRRALVAEAPENPRWRELLGACHSHLGNLRWLRGELAATEEHFVQAQELGEALVAHDPDNTAWRFQLAWSRLDLGRVAFARGELERAAEEWIDARRRLEELLALDDTPFRWRRARAVVLLHFAALERLRDPPRARDTLATALAMLEEFTVGRPSDREARRWLSWGLLLRAQLAEPGPEAEQACREAVAYLGPLAHGARDGRVLAPWAEALACLGHHEESQTVAETLLASGHAEPGLTAGSWLDGSTWAAP